MPRLRNGGKVRAEQGHPAPFNLKYIGIGNEDLISKTFEERYLMIVKAVKEKYPDIVVCGTSGPWSEGSDYETGWRLAKDHKIDMIDSIIIRRPVGSFIIRTIMTNTTVTVPKCIWANTRLMLPAVPTT